MFTVFLGQLAFPPYPYILFNESLMLESRFAPQIGLETAFHSTSEDSTEILCIMPQRGTYDFVH